MSERTPTRTAVIALREERRAMREGCAFLDEKCLLLAAQMLAELRRREALAAQLAPLLERARRAVAAALARHGLNGLQCQPPLGAGERRLALRRHSILGVPLQEVAIEGAAQPASPPAHPSPEAIECREAHAALLDPLARLAAIDGNLARLHAEHRRTARRVRALEDVLLPEIVRDCDEMEAALAELEQDEAIWARSAAGRAR
ncbi:MAG TPA: V-type ATP synthase subunit D [Usitatibacter sp.]|nr:V-type ATP synthase subunit D [Usitatibacter sp.]